jgi:hypothetical protein
MLSAAAIRMAESPICSVLYRLTLDTPLPGQLQCSFDANFADFYENSMSMIGWDLI